MKTILGMALVAGMAGTALATDIDPASAAQYIGGGFDGRGFNEVYNNMPQGGFFTTGASPRTSIGDDFQTGISNLEVCAVNVIFGNQGTVASDVLIRVSIYDTISSAGDWSGLAGQATYRFNALAPGFYFSGDLAVSATLADGEGGAQFEFFDTAGNRLSSGWTVGFNGAGVTLGTSADVYWRDVNNDGTLVASEARTFGGGANLANVAMSIKAVPAPGALALLGLGGLVAGRRRR